MASSIIQFHVLSGCDRNSGLYGVSKKDIVDRIEKSLDGHKLLQVCGNSLPTGDETINDITKFVIRYVYSDVKSNNFLDAKALNPFKPEFIIVIFIHYKPRIAAAILAL